MIVLLLGVGDITRCLNERVRIDKPSLGFRGHRYVQDLKSVYLKVLLRISKTSLRGRHVGKGQTNKNRNEFDL